MFNYMIVVARSRIVEQHFGAISQWCVERERERGNLNPKWLLLRAQDFGLDYLF